MVSIISSDQYKDLACRCQPANSLRRQLPRLQKQRSGFAKAILGMEVAVYDSTPEQVNDVSVGHVTEVDERHRLAALSTEAPVPRMNDAIRARRAANSGRLRVPI